MTSITRTALDRCSTKDCPRPKDREWHDEWMERCANGAEHGHRHDQPTHVHFPKKGMGGNNPASRIVAVICWPLHDFVDNGMGGMGVLIMPDGTGWVRFWDLHGNTIVRGPGASSYGGEANQAVVETNLQPLPDEVKACSAQQASPPSPDAPAPFDTWAQRGETIRNAINATPWAFGDWAVMGEDEFGESAWQEISKGFDRRDYQKVRNWIWVARSIPPSERVPSLSWSHHRAVAHLSPLARRVVLREAAAKGLDRDGLQGLLPATGVAKEPAPPLWTLSELREQASGFVATDVRNNGPRYLTAFLDSLEAS